MNIRNKRIYKSNLKSLAAFLIVAGLCLAFSPVENFAAETEFSITAAKTVAPEDDFDKKFREGRDLIDRQEWKRAAEKFNEIIGKYPDGKSADAAFYWLAFCYKKQKLYKEADAILDRLLEKFPVSSWADDARVMKLEIAAPLGKWIAPNGSAFSLKTLPSGNYVTTLPDGGFKAVAPVTSVEGFKTYSEITALTASRTPLDREDEIKIAAFQSLLSADAKKGIEAMSGILKSDSKASETLKIEVLRAVRRPHIIGSSDLYLSATTLTINSLNKEFFPLLRETLVKSFQNDPNVRIRQEIVYTLANIRDEQSINYLAGLYESENDREVKKAIINGFGTIWRFNGFTAAVITKNGSVSSPNAADKTAAQSLEFAKLLEIFKNEKDVELRSLALNNLQRFGGWNDDGQIADLLIRLYDAETNEEFKKSIVQNLGKIKQTPASKKLLDIAKNDKSDKLRLEAVYALRNSSTPEALKFLEELLK